MEMTMINGVPRPKTEVEEAIRGLIISAITSLEEKSHALAVAKNALNDAYANDDQWRLAKEDEGEGRKARKVIETKIDNSNPVMRDKRQELASEVKDLKSALADYLGEYHRQTGSLEVSGTDKKYRLVPRFSVVPAEQLGLFDNEGGDSE